jgi:hypothetical protein
MDNSQDEQGSCGEGQELSKLGQFELLGVTVRQNDSGSNVSGADLALAEALKRWSGRLNEAGIQQKVQAEQLHFKAEQYN